jgi:pimeloyl-ACP methyl ester carboxylesterase
MRLFCRTYGEGKPLIILHGLLGMSDNWIMPAKELSKTFKVILPDLRNHGNSPHSDDFNLQVLADDIVELIQTSGFELVYLLGHSLGGRIAMSVALQHPQLLEKLVVVDIAPRKYSGNKSISNMIDVMSRVDFNKLATLTAIEEFLTRHITDPRVRNHAMKNLKKKTGGGFEWKANLPIIVIDIETLMTPVYEEIPFTKPALFIKGGASDFITDADMKPIFLHFPKATLRIIPNASHWVHADEPELFIEEVNAFLAE